MTTKYLLPCECGEKLPVDASESGLTRTCPCGAELEVPPLRGLRKLEQVVEPAPPAKPAWGNRQRGVVVGVLIALIGFGVALYWSFSPTMTPYDYFGPRTRDGAKLPEDPEPALVIAFFDTVVQPQGLTPPNQTHVERYHRQLRKDRWWMISALAVGCSGLLVIVVTVLLTIPRKPARRPAARSPQRQPAKQPPPKQPSQ